MNTTGKVLLCSLALMTAGNFEAFSKLKKKRAAPKALLVQLFTNQNKIDFYTQIHATKKLAIEKQQITDINKLIVEDYNNKFSYCPVYYFYDTNYTRINEHKFDGVLLNNELKPAKDIAFPSQDTTYMIAYWGTMVVEDTMPKVSMRAIAASDYPGIISISNRTHMVVMSHNYKTLGQVRGRMRSWTKESKAEAKKANSLYQLTAEKLSHKFIEKFL